MWGNIVMGRLDGAVVKLYIQLAACAHLLTHHISSPFLFNETVEVGNVFMFSSSLSPALLSVGYTSFNMLVLFWGN